MNKSITMKKSVIYFTNLFFLLFLSTGAFSQGSDTLSGGFQGEFDNFLREARKSGLEDFVDSITNSYKQFELANKKAFKKFKKSIEKKWGKDNFISSDKINWVEYSKDKNMRSKVDFKDGTAKVEILIDPKKSTDTKVIKEEVKKAVKDLALSKGATIDYKVGDVTPKPLSDEPVLSGMLKTKKGDKVNEKNVDEFAEEIASSSNIETKEIVGADNVKRMEISVNIPLSKNYLKVRVEKVKPYVETYADEYNIEPALILAVIHVESYYNPKAVSSAKAIGLMQLVPSSGGFEAYKRVKRKNKQPDFNYLINPKNNIELGTAYLHILMYERFGEIKNDNSKRYCTIAAYNTGAGNVSWAITGTKNISRAVKKVNQFNNSKKVYDLLRKKLKYEEARNYLKKVNEKYLFYKNNISEN